MVLGLDVLGHTRQVVLLMIAKDDMHGATGSLRFGVEAIQRPQQRIHPATTVRGIAQHDEVAVAKGPTSE